MDNQVCVQCQNAKHINTTDNRLVTENCGHTKCMDCLFQEKEGCIACSAKNIVKNNGFDEYSPSPNNSPPVKIESSNGRKKGVLPAHIKLSVDVKGKCYICTVCKKTFHARCQISYHSYCDAKHKLPYRCTSCDKKFATHSHYKYHMSVHSGERAYSCDICGDSFYQMSKLQRHKLKHTGEKKFVCEMCNKAFTNCASLRKHRLTHTGEQPYACGKCFRRFRDASNLRKHTDNHEGKQCRCGVCGREFGSPRLLAAHMRACHERPKFQCLRCPRSFYFKKDMRRHSAVHSDLLPFCCKVCVRKFRRKDNLDRHIRNTHPDHVPANVVEVDHKALTDRLQDSNGHQEKQDNTISSQSSKTYDTIDDTTINKSKLEILNPLPPLDREVIQKHLMDCAEVEDPNNKNSEPDNYIKSILEANNARESVIFIPLKWKKVAQMDAESRQITSKNEEYQYVHKIRKAHCMVTQKDMTLPPIDGRKIIELERKTNLNKLDVGSPPKNMEVYKKILFEPTEKQHGNENQDHTQHPEMHWRRKMKLNSN